MTLVRSFATGAHHKMTDHPGWQDCEGEPKRAFNVDGRNVILGAHDWHEAAEVSSLQVDSFSLGETRDNAFAALAASLTTAERIRNPSLWDAIGTAIIRQVIRAPQAKKMYRDFCALTGEAVSDGDGNRYWLFPTPQRVLGLEEEDFRDMGMAFKRKALQAAATAFLEEGATWKGLSPETLVVGLQAVSYIGPWTAKAAVADFYNAWALYPYDDLAVRTWARRAMPNIDWANDEATFGLQWRELGGDRLAEVTLLTLAWGDRHGSAGRAEGPPRRA